MFNNKKRITIIETTLVPLEELRKIFFELLPDIDLVSIVDDSLLKEVIAAGKVTPHVVERMCRYAVTAERIGSDLIFNQCSSVGEAVDIAQNLVNVPILKTDLPMAEEAVKIGGKIGVVATLNTTLGPTSRLIQKVADDQSRKIELIPRICEGAFEKLSQGDKKGHNEIIKETIVRLAEETDAIALAQGSMAVLLPELGQVKTPILSSPRSGVMRAKEMIEKM
jgi:hypothetical protein